MQYEWWCEWDRRHIKPILWPTLWYSPIWMWFGPMWKGVIRPSKKSLTRLKLVRPMLQEPSTNNMMSAAALLSHSNGFLGDMPFNKESMKQIVLKSPEPLVEYMPKSNEAVLEAHGGPTPYEVTLYSFFLSFVTHLYISEYMGQCLILNQKAEHSMHFGRLKVGVCAKMLVRERVSTWCVHEHEWVSMHVNVIPWTNEGGREREDTCAFQPNMMACHYPFLYQTLPCVNTVITFQTNS